MSRKLSPKLHREIRTLRREGVTVRDLSSAYGVSPQSIDYVLKRAGMAKVQPRARAKASS